MSYKTWPRERLRSPEDMVVDVVYALDEAVPLPVSSDCKGDGDVRLAAKAFMEIGLGNGDDVRDVTLAALGQDATLPMRANLILGAVDALVNLERERLEEENCKKMRAMRQGRSWDEVDSRRTAKPQSIPDQAASSAGREGGDRTSPSGDARKDAAVARVRREAASFASRFHKLVTSPATIFPDPTPSPPTLLPGTPGTAASTNNGSKVGNANKQKNVGKTEGNSVAGGHGNSNSVAGKAQLGAGSSVADRGMSEQCLDGATCIARLECAFADAAALSTESRDREMAGLRRQHASAMESMMTTAMDDGFTDQTAKGGGGGPAASAQVQDLIGRQMRELADMESKWRKTLSLLHKKQRNEYRTYVEECFSSLAAASGDGGGKGRRADQTRENAIENSDDADIASSVSGSESIGLPESKSNATDGESPRGSQPAGREDKDSAAGFSHPEAEVGIAFNDDNGVKEKVGSTALSATRADSSGQSGQSLMSSKMKSMTLDDAEAHDDPHANAVVSSLVAAWDLALSFSSAAGGGSGECAEATRWVGTQVKRPFRVTLIESRHVDILRVPRASAKGSVAVRRALSRSLYGEYVGAWVQAVSTIDLEAWLAARGGTTKKNDGSEDDDGDFDDGDGSIRCGAMGTWEAATMASAEMHFDPPREQVLMQMEDGRSQDQVAGHSIDDGLQPHWRQRQSMGGAAWGAGLRSGEYLVTRHSNQMAQINVHLAVHPNDQLALWQSPSPKSALFCGLTRALHQADSSGIHTIVIPAHFVPGVGTGGGGGDSDEKPMGAASGRGRRGGKASDSAKAALNTLLKCLKTFMNDVSASRLGSIRRIVLTIPPPTGGAGGSDGHFHTAKHTCTEILGLTF